MAIRSAVRDRLPDDPRAALELPQLLARLRVGNIPGALTAFTGSAYDKYNEIFNQLQPSLAEIVDQVGEVQDVTFTGDSAELIVVRNSTDGRQLFMIYMLRSEDGIWRIDGM